MANTILLMPHPRAEAIPPGGQDGEVPWNVGQHRRKFLQCGGSYVAAWRGPEHRGVLRFWCEYEPPTYAIRFPKATDPPMWLHAISRSPALAVQETTSAGRCSGGECAPTGVKGSQQFLQNTDPWIWCDGFVWTICRHHRGGRLQQTIRNLGDGDLVLFGSPRKSGKKSEWLLDTVLVVNAPGSPRRPRDVLALNNNDLYATCVLNRLSTNDDVWRPIHGRRWDGSTPDAPFSFVPAMVDRDGARFERPDISSLLNNLRMEGHPGREPSMSANQSFTRCTHPSGVPVFWSDLAQFLLEDRKLTLGTHFDFPAVVQKA